MNWFELQQKNKPQSNALAIGLLLMLISGMHVAFGLLNFSIQYQAWAQGSDQSIIIFVIISWYLASNGGMIIGRVLLPMFGKKLIGFIAIGLFTVSGILYTAAPHMFETILMGRFVAGFGHGLAYLTTIVHGSEIVVKEIRGMLFASLSFMITIAALTTTSSNHVVEIENPDLNESLMDPNRIIGIITLSYVLLAGLLGLFLTYESPVFLIQRNRDTEAREVMMKLRNDTVETNEMLQDYQDLKTMIDEDEKLTSSIFQDGNLRPLITILVLRILSVATFNFPLNFVRTTLCQPVLGATVYILIASVRSVIGSFTLLTADCHPRRSLFHVSGIGSAVSLACLAILYTVNENMNSVVMTIVVLLFDATSGLAITQLTDIYSAEAFPLTKKVDSLLLTTIAENVLHILLILSMLNMDTGRGTKLAILYTFTVCIGVAVAFLSFRVPETRQKTIRETRDMFRGNHSSRPIIYEGSDVPKAVYA